MKKIIFNQELSKYCNVHNNELIKSSEQMIGYCLDLNSRTPDEYRWRFFSKDFFCEKISKLSDPKEINTIYWSDQNENINAYAMMTLWRGVELIKSCLFGLNAKETIAPAIAARSLLELSSVFLLNADQIKKTFNNIQFSNETVVFSTDIEEMVVKMIWGTRYGNPDPHLKQTNIMSFLNKVAKHPSAKDLIATYEFLCDIAHPSFIGNTSYWSYIESINDDGSEQRVMSRLPTRNTNTEILDKTIWSLAWSSFCIRNAFVMMTNASETLMQRIINS